MSRGTKKRLEFTAFEDFPLLIGINSKKKEDFGTIVTRGASGSLAL